MSELSVRRPLGLGRLVTRLQCVLLVLAAATTGSFAFAYPQYAGRGEFNCQDCHYNPTGGGIVNQWGRQSREVTFGPGDMLGGTPDDWWGHDSAEGRGNGGEAELQFDVGGDARLLALIPSGPLVPMLVEAAAVAAYGPLVAYGGVTSRKGSPGLPFVAYSREHWLQYRFTSELSLRAGKLVLPFGVRMVDHTQYVREDLGFDKFDQSYAVEVDWAAESFSLSAAGFAGDLVAEDAALREKGGVARGAYLFADVAELGLSGLVGSDDATERWAASAHLRLRPVSSAYLIVEAALENVSAKGSESERNTTAFFGRAGYFVLPELDIHAEVGHWLVEGADFLGKSRVGLGANWQVWHWLEVIPQLLVETQDEVGTQAVGLLQLHLLY